MGWMVISTSSATMERARIVPSWLHNGSVLFIMTTVRFKRRLHEVRAAEIRSAKVCLIQLRQAEVRPAEM
jgi:hypothetical protein